MEWSDLRYLLAVVRNGSLAAAARELNVDETTVGRRLQSLEQQVGSQLLNRADRRWVPTSAGATAARLAEKIEAEVTAANKEILNQDESLIGRVRLSSVSMVIDHLLAPRVGSFILDYPGIDLEMMASSKDVNLRHLKADIAVRLARPKDPSAVAKKIATIDFKVFARRWHRQRSDRLAWVGFDESLDHIPEAKWINAQLGRNKPVVRVGGYDAIANVLANTPCRALLPTSVARHYPDIMPVSGDKPILQRHLWLVYMKDVRKNARIIAVSRWVVDACREQLFGDKA